MLLLILGIILTRKDFPWNGKISYTGFLGHNFFIQSLTYQDLARPYLYHKLHSFVKFLIAVAIKIEGSKQIEEIEADVIWLFLVLLYSLSVTFFPFVLSLSFTNKLLKAFTFLLPPYCRKGRFKFVKSMRRSGYESMRSKTSKSS